MTNYQVTSWLDSTDDDEFLVQYFKEYITLHKDDAISYIDGLIEASSFSTKFAMVLQEKGDSSSYADSDFFRVLANVIVSDATLFERSAVRLFEYLLLSIKCFTSSPDRNSQKNHLLVRIR